MKTVGLRELRQNASALVRRVEEGEEIIITVAGRPSARLVPTVRDLLEGPAGADWETQGLFGGVSDPDGGSYRGTPSVEWIAAGHTHDDNQLPAPFDSIRFASNNIGASLWVHVASGAMIAAIPTGTWKESAGFAFYYAAPAATSVVPLIGWSSAQGQWDGSDPNDYSRHHDLAIAYFNSRLGCFADSDGGEGL